MGYGTTNTTKTKTYKKLKNQNTFMSIVDKEFYIRKGIYFFQKTKNVLAWNFVQPEQRMEEMAWGSYLIMMAH